MGLGLGLFRRSPFLLSSLARFSPIRGSSPWFLSPLRWKLVALDRSISLPSAFENAQGFRGIRTAASFPEILLRPQGGNFFRDGDIDELV
jgi:hypothetical protein